MVSGRPGTILGRGARQERPGPFGRVLFWRPFCARGAILTIFWEPSKSRGAPGTVRKIKYGDFWVRRAGSKAPKGRPGRGPEKRTDPDRFRMEIGSIFS